MEKLLRLPVQIVLLLVVSTGLFGQTITPVQSTIDFGTIALTDNLASYQLRVRYTGQVIKDPQIIIVSDPSPAEFQLTGFPTFTPLYISINTTGSETVKVTGVPALEQFSISNYDFLPVITTDSSGSATVQVGATLTTSGTSAYTDGIYNLPLTLEVNY